MPKPSTDPGPSLDPQFDGVLARIAESDQPTTVLLTGESGTGKSRAAARIHALSPRAAGPLVTAHLAGLSPTLIEAELFGHRAGSFTGATRDRSGRLQLANGGTIVLEAVETLALPLQVKLLRVLQERIVEPIGAESPEPVDVRVIATTSIDLRGAVERSEFRDDLYFRLAVVPLEVPPLRSQAHGPAFAGACETLCAQVAGRLGTPGRALSAAALERLAEHPWPGNFRELENALERVLVLGGATGAPSGEISADEFAFLSESTEGQAGEVARLALAHGVGIVQLERAVFDEALAESRGNVSAAARRVGLSRRAFDYRRKKLDAED